MKIPSSIIISGKEVLPIIEGGKGVAISNGLSAGAFAAAGAVGTFSGVNADSYDEDGNIIEQVYNPKHTRKQKFEQLIEYGIAGGIAQAKIAHEKSNGNGRILSNILWEAGGSQQVIKGVLEGTKGLIHGIVSGAGMPFKLPELTVPHKVWYYPIVSSSRAFKLLWKRSYSKAAEWLGAVIYEDPWLAGGHNGLSNTEDPLSPQSPYERLVELRNFMNSVGLEKTPIIIAGGVWSLADWQDYIDNKEIGDVGFQFGTRPLLTQESTISKPWKDMLRNLKPGDVGLNKFSPTGFWSSAVKNSFLKELQERSERQIAFSDEQDGEFNTALNTGGARARNVFVSEQDFAKANKWIADGFDKILRTPDKTVIFVTKERAKRIRVSQAECMGCLSQCSFSNWADNEENTTGKLPDPRSYCIQKTLQRIAHGENPDENLSFAGHHGWRFSSDELFANGKEPTVAELVDAIMRGQ